MNEKLKVMVVEDEPLARQGLLIRLKSYSQLSLVSACASADDAIVLLDEVCPDIIFLDIEMPGMSGVEFAKYLFDSPCCMPKIIFVTAYREFAIDAFGIDAFDYLLKPICEERFNQCIQKTLDAFGLKETIDVHNKLSQLLVEKTGNSVQKFIHNLEKSEAGKLSEQGKIIALKSGTEWLRLSASSINWIEAAGDYMCVHTSDNTHIIRRTLKQFEEDLDDENFMRVSRSAIINTQKVTKLSPNSNGEYFATLSSGDTVKVTRSYKSGMDRLCS